MSKASRISLDLTLHVKILWVKFGWSDYYRGGQVDGNFGWLNAAEGGKDEGRGHEAFNFALGGDGTYYCYVPPQSKEHAPWNDDNIGWTVICLAKNPKHKGIHVVGWYENATLFGHWRKPPSNHPAAQLSKGSTAYDWSYCISSKSAFFIPPDARIAPFSHSSIRQGKYSFLKGPGIRNIAKKIDVLDILQSTMNGLKSSAIRNPNPENAPDPELNPSDPLSGFGTLAHRKEVETAAEAAVIAYYESRGCQAFDCTKLNCGYDYRFEKHSKILDVEIKGTSGKRMRFFLTRNELDTGLKVNPHWRLAVVTDALGDKTLVQIFDRSQTLKLFELVPYVYICNEIFSSR